MLEAIAIGVFVFVTIAVAGFRAIDTIERRKAEAEADRRRRALGGRSNEYSGGYFNVHGREVK